MACTLAVKYVQGHAKSIYPTCGMYILIHNFIQATVSIKTSNFLICFCSFDMSCSVLEKNIFIEIVYILLSCLIKQHSFFLTLFVSIFSYEQSYRDQLQFVVPKTLRR